MKILESERGKMNNNLKINYTDSLGNLTANNLQGFFVGWLNFPSPETHFELLKNSDEIILATDEETDRVSRFYYRYYR